MTDQERDELLKAAEHCIAGIESSDPADIGDILFQRSERPLYLSMIHRVATALPALLADSDELATLREKLAGLVAAGQATLKLFHPEDNRAHELRKAIAALIQEQTNG